MKTLVIGIIAMLTLAGCEGMPTRGDHIAAKAAECSAYGYEQGTRAHAQCVQVGLDQHDRRMAQAWEAVGKMGMYYSTPVAQRGALVIY